MIEKTPPASAVKATALPDPSEPPSAATPEKAHPSSRLGRIAGHLRRQHWTAITIEFIAVVFGVLLGLQLNNWNEARVEAKRRGEIVQALITNLNDLITVQQRLVDSIDTGLADWQTAYADGQKPTPFYFRIIGSDKAPAVWSTFEQMQLTDLFDPVTLFDLSFFYSELEGMGQKYIRYVIFVEDKVLPGAVRGGKAFYEPDGELIPEFRANMDRLRDFQTETRVEIDWAHCLIYRLKANRTFDRSCRRANYRLDTELQRNDRLAAANVSAISRRSIRWFKQGVLSGSVTGSILTCGRYLGRRFRTASSRSHRDFAAPASREGARNPRGGSARSRKNPQARQAASGVSAVG